MSFRKSWSVSVETSRASAASASLPPPRARRPRSGARRGRCRTRRSGRRRGRARRARVATSSASSFPAWRPLSSSAFASVLLGRRIPGWSGGAGRSPCAHFGSPSDRALTVVATHKIRNTLLTKVAQVCQKPRSTAIGRSAYLCAAQPVPASSRAPAGTAPPPGRSGCPARPAGRGGAGASPRPRRPARAAARPRWKRTVAASGKRRVSGPSRENAALGLLLS